MAIWKFIFTRGVNGNVVTHAINQKNVTRKKNVR